MAAGNDNVAGKRLPKAIRPHRTGASHLWARLLDALEEEEEADDE